MLLWRALEVEGALPLVKILETDALATSQGQGLYQFKHLSFQEVLALQAVTGEEGLAPWVRAGGATAATRVVDFVAAPFYRNMLRIGGEALARALAAWAGGDIEVANENGFTALLLSCMNGHEATARALLAAGANIDEKIRQQMSKRGWQL